MFVDKQKEPINIFIPRFNITVRTSSANAFAENSLYINGISEESSAAHTNKTLQYTVRGRNALFAVADNISETVEGEISPAEKVCRLIKQSHPKLELCDKTQLEMQMKDFLTDANGEISTSASAMSLDKYGAAYAMAHIADGKITFSNTGNVTGFYFKGGELTQMTENHTDVYSEAARSQEDGEVLLTKYVGSKMGGESLRPYVSDTREIDKDDIFLLCSNEVADKLPVSRIAHILALQSGDDKIVRRLINESLARGAEGEFTVMLIRNGGRAFDFNKKVLNAVKITAAVVIVAIAAAFTAVSLKSCAQKPAISRENPNANVAVENIEGDEFAVHESKSSPIPTAPPTPTPPPTPSPDGENAGADAVENETNQSSESEAQNENAE